MDAASFPDLAALAPVSPLAAVARAERANCHLRRGEPVAAHAYEQADFERRKKLRPDYYAMLDCRKVSSEREIKGAYWKQSLAHHRTSTAPTGAPQAQFAPRRVLSTHARAERAKKLEAAKRGEQRGRLLRRRRLRLAPH
ncbi:hypothetical protein JL721_7126 [Aureococcus anophagefferens]|nr:hypothetical protein JL721_7126 [Aureococcus anophagefferens]